MGKADTRRPKQEVLPRLREQAVRLRKKGWTYAAIAEAIGVSYCAVSNWCRAFKDGGDKAIRLKKRGRKPGTKRTLTPEQENQIRRAIRDKCPEQLKLPFALWTRGAIQQLIKRLVSIDMPIRTVGAYLKRWGYTPQKPLRQANEQNPKVVQKWLDEEYPAIEAKAKKEKAEIHWRDETGLRNDSQYGRSYAPRGKTPAVLLSAKRGHVSLISTITSQGKVRFMVYENAMNSQTLIKFLKRLVKDTDRKVFLILDNIRVHHSKMVKEWLASHKDDIEVFFLPPYSPELNPYSVMLT